MDSFRERIARALYEDWVREEELSGYEYCSWELLLDKPTWLSRADAILALLANPGEDVVEKVARAVMVDSACGMTLNSGEARVFCNDPRLPYDIRSKYGCECQSAARAALSSLAEAVGGGGGGG